MMKRKKKPIASLSISVTMLALMLTVGVGNVYAALCGDTSLDGYTDTMCNCGDTVVGKPCVRYIYVLPADLNCSLVGNTPSRHGLIIGSRGIGIDGNGYTIDGGGVEGRNCEVLTYVEDDCGGPPSDPRIWCEHHPCRQAIDGGVLSSGIVNANTLSASSCNPAAPVGQGGYSGCCEPEDPFSPLVIKNVKITGWCDGIWMSGDCDTGLAANHTRGESYGNNAEYRLKGIVIEGNCIYDNGNNNCGNYTPATCEDGGDWERHYYNDAIFTAQIGMDEANSSSEYPCPECMKDTNKEFPDLVADGTTCVCQSECRNIIWHNKIYSQKGCACVSCAGGNGINLQGGLEIDDVLWSGCNEIEKNVVKNCAVSGIQFTHATTYNRIHGNYLLGNGLGGIANGCGWCSGSYIYDNVAKGNYGVGIAVAAMAKIKNNIVIDTQPVKNDEFKDLGYGDLPGDGIMTIAPCHPLAAAAGICVAGTGTELLGNTSVGNAGDDIVDMFENPAGVHVAKAWGDENMCLTTPGPGGYFYGGDTILGPNGVCRYEGGARLNCRADINHDCNVNINDFFILRGEWMDGPDKCCPCASTP